jgi:hypothetical protein
MYGTWFDNQGVPRISLGPHWPMYFCLSSFLGIIGFGCTFWLAPQIHPILAWAGLLCTTFCVGSYTIAAFSNPGIVLPIHDEIEAAKIGRYCKTCEVY